MANDIIPVINGTNTVQFAFYDDNGALADPGTPPKAATVAPSGTLTPDLTMTRAAQGLWNVSVTWTAAGDWIVTAKAPGWHARDLRIQVEGSVWP